MQPFVSEKWRGNECYFMPHVYIYKRTDGRADGRTDEAATICSPVGEHKKGAMMALDRSHESLSILDVLDIDKSDIFLNNTKAHHSW